ncbi:MAG: DUF3048 C-terminal domain-containing protein [Clostridiales bacterium]|nr:DUF3048 C-terminal domain-containing protein [Clostridiales bacterium]
MKLKKFASLVAGAMLLTTSMAACSGDKETTTATTTTVATTTSETTAEASQESETTAATTDESLKADSANPLIDPNNNMALDPLTGIQDMDPANVGKRSIATTISNLKEATPSKGTIFADVIYEYKVEDVTRLLCVFPDVTKIPVIGSFRSARVVAADLASGSDSIFVHWGADPTKFPGYFKDYNIDHIDMNAYDAGWQADIDGKITLNGNKFSWRCLHWKKEDGRAMLNCAVTNGEQIQRAVSTLGIRTETDQKMLFNFVPDGKAAMTGATDCKDLTVYFSTLNPDAHFVFNDKDKCYYKSEYGDTPQMDQSANEQLHFKNVFVIFADVQNRNDGAGHLDFYFDRGGEGYYVSNGKMIKIKWEKPNPMDQIKVMDENGKEIEVNAGKSYVCVVDQDLKEKTTWS